MDRSFGFLPKRKKGADGKASAPAKDRRPHAGGGEDTPGSGVSRFVSLVYDIGDTAVFALICIVLLFTFLIRVVGVEGDSMNNTLKTQDRLLLLVAGYTPERGDIVVVDRYTQEPLIKRVIALEGDVIDIDPETHAVSVNGEVLDEPYISTQTDLKDFSGPQKVPEGMVFVMGDNRTYSKDSRTAEIGFVEASDIVGRAVFRIWPFGSAGAL